MLYHYNRTQGFVTMSALKTVLLDLFSQSHLTCDEAEGAMIHLLDEVNPHQTAAFLAILKYKGETPAEVAGMVRALEKKRVPIQFSKPVLDIVGTGGDLAHTVNISTGAAFLAASCQIPVAKHGNRSVSSLCGSADVLEELGVPIDLPRERLEACLDQNHFAFMFAPLYHPVLKKIAPIRKALEFPTVCNLLGPLLNPAKAEYMLIGVPNQRSAKLMSHTLLQLGHTKKALVFHGQGLDELTTIGKISAYLIESEEITPLEIDPIALGFRPCSLNDLQGGSKEINAQLLTEVFKGKTGALADTLVLNAATALYIYGKVPSIADGIPLARKAQAEGRAFEVLEKLKRFV